MSVVTSVLAFFLKASLGRRMAPTRSACCDDVFAQRAVEFVQRALGGDEQDQAAGAHFFQGRREEVIVDEEVPALEARVERLVIAKGDVANGHVEAAVGKPGLLEGLVPDVGVGVEQFGQARRDGVNFDAGDAGTRRASRRA